MAVLRYDMHWPDEHFQTLEPAAKIVYGYGLMSWEWLEGFRSWIMPAVFVPLLFVLKIFGVTGGLIPILGSRVFFAVASLALIWGLDRLQMKLGFSRLTRWLSAVWISFSISMLLWAPATLSDTWIAYLWWGLLPFVLSALERKRGFLAGFLASLPFLFRFQAGFLGAVLGLLVFSHKNLRSQTLPVFLGGLTNILIYGLVDWVTLGAPWGSLVRQLTEGIKKSEFYGVSPWWDYLRRVPEDLGWATCGVAIALIACASALRFLRESRRPALDPVKKMTLEAVFLPVFIYAVIHSLIPHKETRFVFVFYPAIFMGIAMAVESLTAPLPGRWKNLEILHPIIQVLLIISISLGSLFALKDRPLYLTSVDTAGLLDQIYREEKTSPVTVDPTREPCVLFVENNWSFTRGSLGMGRQFAGIDRNFDQLETADLVKCKWVIARPSTFPMVENRSRGSGRKFELVTEAFSGFALYR